MNALDLIHAVPEVEKHLVDDMSRKIYNMRMEYLVYRNIFALRDEIKKLGLTWRVRPDVKNFLDRSSDKRFSISGTA